MEKVREKDLGRSHGVLRQRGHPPTRRRIENHIDVCFEKYSLDPSHYVTAAHFANDAMMKVTGVEIELLTDPDMYLFFEESKRGGVSSAMKRYMKANNKT